MYRSIIVAALKCCYIYLYDICAYSVYITNIKCSAVIRNNRQSHRLTAIGGPSKIAVLGCILIGIQIVLEF